jgi:hypothetical protein
VSSKKNRQELYLRGKQAMSDTNTGTTDSDVKTPESDTETIQQTTTVVEEQVGQQPESETYITAVLSTVAVTAETTNVQPTSVQSSQPLASKAALMIQKQIQNYIEAMSVKAPNPVQGGQWQKTLYLLLKQVLSEADPGKFREEWNAILNVAQANAESVFHENYIFRFPQHWNLSDSEGTVFRRLITLIKMTSDPQNRFQQNNAIHLERATAGLTETQKNNILNFYN